MQTPSSLYLWLSEQAGPMVVLATLLALIMIVLYVSARNRQARMNRERSGVSESAFAEALVPFGFDPALSRLTYRYFEDTREIRFPIQPKDRLDEDLGLDGVNIEQSLLDLLALSGRLYQPGLRFTPLLTVEDLIRFLQASPRRSETARRLFAVSK